MVTLGILEEITDLRKVWPNEAQDFTPWLAKEENIARLSSAIGIDIVADETESSVGDFSADLLASEEGTARKIIIENQLEDTNHDHLGKLITYASGKDASIVIWIVKRARDEHRSAIEWLNKHTDEAVGFFLCEIKLYRIGNSNPAVKFEVIERPNDWTKGQKASDAASPAEQLTQKRRQEYFSAFQDHVFQNEQFKKTFNRTKPPRDHWMTFAIGSSACNLQLLQVRKVGQLGVQINIPDDKTLFHMFESNKETIESECGFELDWRELPDKKASRIIILKDVVFEDKEQWPEQFDWAMDTLLHMRKAFCKYL